MSYKSVDFSSVAMDKDIQISALISRSTKDLLEQHVRATGVKKGHLVEQALRHHLQALQELPTDVIVHPVLVVDRSSGQSVAETLEKGKPTPALRKLLRDGD